MTREEMLQDSYRNRGNRYTTEEWQEDGDYVTTNRNGYLEYANGEEVLEDEDLPEDGWYDCTDYNEEDDEDILYNENYDSALYDENDEW